VDALRNGPFKPGTDEAGQPMGATTVVACAGQAA
jgi:hypothetical protein